MERVQISASKLRQMSDAAAWYSRANNVPESAVYVMFDTGINYGAYVVSDIEWDERERLGQPHPAPRIPPSSEGFPHGGGRLGRSAELAEQSGFYPEGRPTPRETAKPGQPPSAASSGGRVRTRPQFRGR